jgi:predicted dienelactone hydrolase
LKLQVSVLFLAIFLSGCTDLGTADASSYVSPDGPYTITTALAVLTDGSRGWYDNGTWVPTREIPVKVCTPDLAYKGPFPLIMVSHGLWGDLNSVAYLAEDLAAHGYIVVSVQHHRSDGEYYIAYEDQPLVLTAAAADPATRLLRPQDISFVLDAIEDGTTGTDLLNTSRIDLTRIGMLGHSFGAWTTLSCLGQTFDSGTNAADPRIDCGVAYSPQGPGTLGLDATSWDGLTRPTFTMHGTEDIAPGTDDPAERRIPFDSMPATGAKYHATLTDATHADFGNIAAGFYHDWIKQMTMAFCDAHLRDNADARAWLEAATIERLTGYVSLERK